MSRDSQTDSSRDGSGQLRKTDPDVIPIDMSPWTLVDEKRAHPDAPGTAEDEAGLTDSYGSVSHGFRPKAEGR